MKKTEVKQVTMTPFEGSLVEKKAKMQGITVSNYLLKLISERVLGLTPTSYDATDYILNTISKAEFEEITDQYDAIESVMITYLNNGIGYEFLFLFDGDRLVFKGNKFNHSCQNISFDYEKVIIAINEHYETKLIKNESSAESNNDYSELSEL